MNRTSIHSYVTDTRETVIFSRDPRNNVPVYKTQKLDFYESNALARAFEIIYQQGIEHGQQGVAAAVRKALPVSEEG